jgi:hypothetical protein
MSQTPDDALDDAIARHYAKQQEGLPPLPPPTPSLRQPHRQWLATYFPMPPPEGGWGKAPTFEWYLEHEWPAIAAERAAALAAVPPDLEP